MPKGTQPTQLAGEDRDGTYVDFAEGQYVLPDDSAALAQALGVAAASRDLTEKVSKLFREKFGQPAGPWRQVRVRDGAKGPMAVKVLLATAQTKDEDGCVGPRERLVVLRGVGK
jgi:hypothetical protein